MEELIALMNNKLYDEFFDLYLKCLSTLKPFEHVELLLRGCRLGLLSFVKRILNNDSSMVDVNCSHSSTGYPPLYISIRAQQHLIIEYLIRETTVDINWTCNQTGQTSLHQAIHQWDLSTVTLLLKHGAIVNQTHLFISIIESFRRKNEKQFPLTIIDKLISHQPDLLDDLTRKAAAELILHRSSFPFINQNNLIIPVIEKLSLNNEHSLSEHILSSSVKQPETDRPNLHKTQVCIIGAGPAGLTVGALLYQAGIDSIILEQFDRSFVESNIRAGVLEQSTIDLLDEIGVSDRLFRDAFIQRNIYMQFNGERICLPITELTEGKVVSVYGQHLVLEDLIQSRIENDQRLWFDMEYVHIERHDLTDDGKKPLIKFRRRLQSEEEEIECDFIAGCDGASSKCCRRSIPTNIIKKVDCIYPYSWLSILVDARPTDNQLVYGFDEEYGFALHSFRSTSRTRFHLQVSNNDTLDDWTDDQIWDQLEKRLNLNDQSWKIGKGPILQRALFPLRNSIYTPMQYKRLFLVGDAAHILPPTAAKGLNLAVKDALILSKAFIDYYQFNKLDQLNDYTKASLPHVIKTSEFANYMTLLLHKLNIQEKDNQNQFELLLQKARQEQLQSSPTLQAHLAKCYAN